MIMVIEIPREHGRLGVSVTGYEASRGRSGVQRRPGCYVEGHQS